MSLLPILRYPDQRLAKTALPVTCVDEKVRKLVSDMAETMYEAPGIGLAATQVDIHLQVVVIDVSEEKNELRVFINPRIIENSGSCEGEEGCLSVPGVYENVCRAERVAVRFVDLQGQEQTIEAEGILAVCLQHEIDHLNGKLFVQYLSPLKQTRIKTKLAKRARITA